MLTLIENLRRRHHREVLSIKHQRVIYTLLLRVWDAQQRIIFEFNTGKMFYETVRVLYIRQLQLGL